MLPLYYTQGGIRSYVMWSGTIAGDVAITSGLGRLHSILPHNNSVSGQPVYCYDSAIAVSGGPVVASGHKIIGGIPAAPPLGVSGTFNAPALTPTFFYAPFSSGLCLSSRSGQPGVTVFYTNEPDREY